MAIGSVRSLAIPGMADLWTQTLGDPDICIAVLDGPVDLSHPCFRGAQLTRLETLVSGQADSGPACRHGTHAASLIFGQHHSAVCGIAPRCRGLLVPIFACRDGASLAACSQLDLARALGLAVQHGARVINVSGGQFTPSGTAHPLLAEAVAECSRRGVLIVAATGNEGCACLHVPAALDSVLAVGAMTVQGEPLDFSNWGGPYQTQGILAPGEDLLGAQPGGGTARSSGTSFATAIVSGVAALLLCLQRRHGRLPDPRRVRRALIQSARGCAELPTTDCRRLLAGRLNVEGAVSILVAGEIHTMSEVVPAEESSPVPTANGVQSAAAEAPVVLGSGVVQPAVCGCQGPTGSPQLVYAIGQLGYDLVSEARLDSLAQKMAGVVGDTMPERLAAFQPAALLRPLEAHPADASAVEWTLNLDGTPVFALRPQGPFAAETYLQLRHFLREQLHEGVERISVPGVMSGKATLLVGQAVPVLAPELRGMYSWTIKALVDAVVGTAPAADAPAEAIENHEQKKAGLRNFLDRVYFALRNLGIMSADRALNFAATNVYSVGRAFEGALKEKERMELDSINVVRSPICRPSSDCWDVELYFFFPDRQVQTVRKVYRLTVDVSDVVPVTIGPMRSWFTR